MRITEQLQQLFIDFGTTKEERIKLARAYEKLLPEIAKLITERDAVVIGENERHSNADSDTMTHLKQGGNITKEEQRERAKETL